MLPKVHVHVHVILVHVEVCGSCLPNVELHVHILLRLETISPHPLTCACTQIHVHVCKYPYRCQPLGGVWSLEQVSFFKKLNILHTCTYRQDRIKYTYSTYKHFKCTCLTNLPISFLKMLQAILILQILDVLSLLLILQNRILLFLNLKQIHKNKSANTNTKHLSTTLSSTWEWTARGIPHILPEEDNLNIRLDKSN